MAFQDKNGIARIVLTNFIGARIVEEEDDNGRVEKGVFIPLEMNDLRVTKHGHVNCYAFVMKTMTPQQFGWSHYLKLKVRPDFCKKMNELGYQMPYVGNFKYENYIVFKNNYKDKFVKNDKNGI